MIYSYYKIYEDTNKPSRKQIKECIRSNCRSIHHVSEWIWSNWRSVFRWGNVGNFHLLNEGMHSELQLFYSFKWVNAFGVTRKCVSPAFHLFNEGLYRYYCRSISMRINAFGETDVPSHLNGRMHSALMRLQYILMREYIRGYWRYFFKYGNSLGITDVNFLDTGIDLELQTLWVLIAGMHSE